jgi:two-component system, chemotaxis family, chemotaxis protein CheY
MFPKDTNILVVDDMSTMRKLVAKTLKDLGFTVITDAVDGEDAWKKIQDASTAKKPFQLILSDWNMPKMKGIDLLAKVRGTSTIASTAFILLTAEAEKDQVAIALQAGVNGYLLKPFTKEQLSEVLTTVFGKTAKAA